MNLEALFFSLSFLLGMLITQGTTETALTETISVDVTPLFTDTSVARSSKLLTSIFPSTFDLSDYTSESYYASSNSVGSEMTVTVTSVATETREPQTTVTGTRPTPTFRTSTTSAPGTSTTKVTPKTEIRGINNFFAQQIFFIGNNGFLNMLRNAGAELRKLEE